MGQSYRIRTELGINKSINVELNQDFEFLEILSLKIQQADVYTRSCADYGVVVGRVTANNGLGIPNAKVSVFIPVEEEDLLDDTINAIYPYRTIDEKNEDGYRYNLLPYEKSYSKHAATGTFPSSRDVLTNSVASKIYEKYFRFTVKTNESGDYMIFGVPLGFQRLVMDVDLSDMGEFSLTPQDLIRIGRATESQVDGNQFRTSTDLNSLPQIVRLTKIAEISPLWGEPQICQIAVNRIDFDLRDDANIDIQPTSIFMGSVFSTTDKYRLRKNCKPKDNMGNLCDLVSGPGQILAVRQTIRQDVNGNPILEQLQLEQSGNVIDEDGTWLTELPMNLDYITTNEFGQRVLSFDPNIGVPTKAKYRFKIKWQQSRDLVAQTRRAYFLVPNVREYGWQSGDPTDDNPTSVTYKQQRSSYYFGLDWTGYTEGLTTTESNNKIDQIVNCEDTFYEFKFNRVYTVSGLIDQYKQGGRAQFIGIKEVDDDSCSSSVNKFPVNEGFKNFDFLYFIFSLIFQNLQFIGLAFLIVAHITIGTIYQIITAIGRLFGRPPKRRGLPIRLPMVTYPDCQACECKEAQTTGLGVDLSANGVLTPLSLASNYQQGWVNIFSSINYQPSEDIDIIAQIHAQATGGNNSNLDPKVYKVLKSDVVRELSDDGRRMFCYSYDLPMGERINIFNSRNSYFQNTNRIKVSFATDYSNNNSLFHLDNTITVLAQQEYLPGSILTTVNPDTSTDYNFNFSGSNQGQTIFGITGNSITGENTITVNYVNPTNQLSELTQVYNLPYGSRYSNNAFPIDREYFQVITAITVNQYLKICSKNPTIESFADIINSKTVIRWMEHRTFPAVGYRERGLSEDRDPVAFKDLFNNFDNQYVLILQRGVDPYSPKYQNKYNLGLIFGSTIDDPKYIITASTKLNIPIQKLSTSQATVQGFTQSAMFYPSYFFEPGTQFSAFTSNTVGYYSLLDVFSQPSDVVLTDDTFYGGIGVRTRTVNKFYSDNPNNGRYDLSEDLSGNAFLESVQEFLNNNTYDSYMYEYVSINAFDLLSRSPMLINNKTKNIMRTDRLPSSDQLDGPGFDSNAFVLQQNNNFAFYEVPDLETGTLVPVFSTGFDQPIPDVEGLPNTDALKSFDCLNMVGLECYSGNSGTFGVSSSCSEKDLVERGCYVFFTNPLFGLTRDIKYFQEWGYRFRFFYGVCRGVLSQTFTNNWVNGTLFAFPIQVDTFYNRQNRPSEVKYCTDVVYYEKVSNNFYYRSSPYNEGKFIGKPKTQQTMVNQTNLLYPTTIINLGFKDSFYNEITTEPSSVGYVVDKLNPTSFSDTSDLVNLFVISRITNKSFLDQFFSFVSRNNSIDQLFSRNENSQVTSIFNDRNRRVDGDFAQMISINSEEGNISFSPEFYTSQTGTSINPVGVYGTTTKPTIGVFYSSTTEELQFKDYITPGRINFRPTPTYTSTPFEYGIKSQVVPFYRWGLVNNSQIFGTEKNNWATTTTDLVQHPYQSLDRTNPEHYFMAQGLQNDLSERGYIFNVSGDTISEYSQNYKLTGPVYSNRFIVGAPFHFYFGTVVGASALDKFKTKYSVDE